MNTLYQQRLLDHYRNSPHKKTVKNATIATKMANPSCGDKVAFTVLLEGDIIKDIGFEGSGCVLSVAAASLLCEQVLGKTMGFIAGLTADDMKQLVGVEVGPVRLKCVLLPLEALQKN